MPNPTDKGYFVELNNFSILLARSSALRSPFMIEDIREVPLDNKAGLEEAVQAIFPETKSGTSNVFAALRPKQHGFYLSSADEAKKVTTLAAIPEILAEPALASFSPCEFTAVYSRDGLAISGQGEPWLLATAAKESYAQALAALQELKLVPSRISPATLSAAGGLAAALKLKGDGSSALLFEFGEISNYLLLVSANGVEAVRATAVTMDNVAEAVQVELGLKFKGSAAKLFFNESYDFSETSSKIAARIAQQLAADISALGHSPASFACTGLPAKQNWFASNLAGALNLAPFAPDLKNWCTQSHLSFSDGAVESSLTPAWLGFLNFIGSYQVASPERSVWQPDWTRATPPPAPAVEAAPPPAAAPIPAPAAVVVPPAKPTPAPAPVPVPAAVVTPPAKSAPAPVTPPPKPAATVPPAAPGKPAPFVFRPMPPRPGATTPPIPPAKPTPAPFATPVPSAKPTPAPFVTPPATPAKASTSPFTPTPSKPATPVPPGTPAKPQPELRFTPPPPKPAAPPAPALPIKPAAAAPVKPPAPATKPIAAPPPRPIGATPPKPVATPAPAPAKPIPPPAPKPVAPAPVASGLTKPPSAAVPASSSAKPGFFKGQTGMIVIAAAVLVVGIFGYMAYSSHQQKVAKELHDQEEAAARAQLAAQKAAAEATAKAEAEMFKKAQEEAAAKIAAAEAAQKAAEEKARIEEAAHIAAARGQMNIATEPTGATVAVDELPPRTSPALFTNLKLGHYAVTVTFPNYEPAKLDIEVKENETADPGVIKLIHETGSLELASDPPGMTYNVHPSNNGLLINMIPGGTLTGTTPATLNEVPSGDYTVTFSRPGFEDHNENVTVTHDTPAKISWKFTNGNVLITSTPSGATVTTADGKPIGTTPVTINDVQPGDVTYTLNLDGYDPATISGKVEGGKTNPFTATLLSVNRLAKLSDLDVQPQAIHQEQPELPTRIFDRGVVEISLTVDRSGNPKDLIVVQNTTNNQEIAQYCLDAVAKWKFKPGYIDDKPVNVRVTVPFTITP